jgi:hypothetical protein
MFGSMKRSRALAPRQKATNVRFKIMAAAVPLALVTLGLALAPPAAAATITSNITLSYSAGSAPAGYAYPNQTITFTGDVDPSNSTYTRQVRLMRWVPSTALWVVAKDYKATAAGGGFSFTDTIPRNEAYARWNVQTTQRTAGGSPANVWTSAISPTLVITQTHGSEALSMTTASPKIVETGGKSTVESTANAGQLARVDYVGGGAARVINLQQRDSIVWGDSYWHDLPESYNIAAGESGPWYPKQAFFGGSEYRAIYHYTTGVDNASSVFQPTNVIPEFSDEFSGTTLSTKWAQRGPRINQGWMVNSMDPDVVSVSDGAVHLTPRVAADSACTGAITSDEPGVNDIDVPKGYKKCIKVPHITTEEKYVGDADFDGVDDDGIDDGTSFAPPSDGVSVWLAARAKVQPGNGSHSAFWWNSGYCEGGETDVMEYFGDGRTPVSGTPGGLLQNVYWTAETAPNPPCDDHSQMIQRRVLPSEAGLGSAPWSSTYHIYSVRVSQSTITVSNPDPIPAYTFYVDGVQTHTSFATGPRSSLNIFNQLILSNIVSDYENVGDGSAGSTFDVDWVQVWRMPTN